MKTDAPKRELSSLRRHPSRGTQIQESVQNPPNQPAPIAPAGARPELPRRRVFAGFSEVITNPLIGWLALVGLILGMFVFPPAGMGLSTCGMKSSIGIPCPGCGLTRSVTSTLHGHPIWAWKFNPFGILFALFFVTLWPLAFLTRRMRERVCEFVRPKEHLVAIAIFSFMGGLVIHGVVRAALIFEEHPAYSWWEDDTNPPFVTDDFYQPSPVQKMFAGGHNNPDSDQETE